MAPGANIVLLTSPVAETEGVQGLPQFLALEKYALQHKLGNIISQSWGATENTLFDAAGQQVINDFEDFYQQTMNENVTVLAAAGDGGSANPDVNNNIYPFPTVNFPASSPFVTSVGGTSEGSPQWAGIIADANQLAGHPLGFLNPKLYAIGEEPELFNDIEFGSNASNGVPGFTATRGWDLVTGWGTPDLGTLVWKMAQQ